MSSQHLVHESVIDTNSYYRDDIINNTIVIRLMSRNFTFYPPICTRWICICAASVVIWLCISGCALNFTSRPPSDQGETAAAQVGQLTDANDIMQGICFDAAFDAAGNSFVLHDESQLSKLFDLADNSRLCDQPVERKAFDFSGGAVLAGTWSKGIGCTARHEIAKVKVNEERKRIKIVLNFITEGDCNYELVQPYWVDVSSAKDYEIKLRVK